MGAHPTICFVGPAIGRHRGHVTTQGEVLAGLFAAEGDPVLVTSTVRHKLVRAADTFSCLLRWRREIDVAVISVFSGNAFTLADQQAKLATSLHLPIVLWLHGGDLPNELGTRPEVARAMFGRAARVVTPSDYLREAAEPLGAEVTVIPNVLDLDAYDYRARTSVEPRLLWMRTFHELYRPDLALAVLAGLRDDHPDATLTMAGHDAGLQRSIEEQARARGLRDAVRFPGFLDRAGKERELAAHDVFLNTNQIDNTPVGVLEAAASGLPVVATSVGGVPYLLTEGETGLLVPDGDADAMTAAVRRLLDDPALAARLSTGGRALAEASAWPRVRDAWRSLVERVLAG